MTGPTPLAGAEQLPRRREHTRSRIVEAAADVFAEKALRRVTVDDVVAAAGYTRGAFYSNFSGIDELFFDVYAHQADQMIAAVREVLEGVSPEKFTLESLREVLGALHPFGRRWFLIQNEFALFAVRDATARETFKAESRRMQGSIEELVHAVLTLLHREPVVPMRHLTDAVIALYLHSLGNEQLETGGLDPQSLEADLLPRVVLALSRPAA
ncbi:TetR/AcrR family transcriptional regulator [Nocardioides caldifontis]|uniref:TetR/AcrR family transcriptional regulator n=1 Tax=Nocardioides caldifontis TaxID=2588938 RepID=UPI0011DF0B67|nr:TetR/AcrR family transcriptional regulator [Nocardioides caldifontis]